MTTARTPRPPRFATPTRRRDAARATLIAVLGLSVVGSASAQQRPPPTAPRKQFVFVGPTSAPPATAAPRPPAPPAQVAPPQATAERDARSTAELDVASLPIVQFSSTFAPALVPDQLSPSDAQGIRVTQREGAPRPPGQPVPVKLEGEPGVIFQVTTPHAPQLAVPTRTMVCDARTAARPTAVDWQTISIDPHGNAWLTSSSGWFDPRACRVAPRERAVVQLHRAMSHQGLPLAFVYRTAQGLSFVIPGAGSIASESSMRPTTTTRGVFSQLVVPLAKGASSSAAVQANADRIEALVRPLAPNAPERILGSGEVTLRIEVSQTVGEAAPLALVSVRLPAR